MGYIEQRSDSNGGVRPARKSMRTAKERKSAAVAAGERLKALNKAEPRLTFRPMTQAEIDAMAKADADREAARLAMGYAPRPPRKQWTRYSALGNQPKAAKVAVDRRRGKARAAA